MCVRLLVDEAAAAVSRLLDLNMRSVCVSLNVEESGTLLIVPELSAAVCRICRYLRASLCFC